MLKLSSCDFGVGFFYDFLNHIYKSTPSGMFFFKQAVAHALCLVTLWKERF